MENIEFHIKNNIIFYNNECIICSNKEDVKETIKLIRLLEKIA